MSVIFQRGTQGNQFIRNRMRMPTRLRKLTKNRMKKLLLLLLLVITTKVLCHFLSEFMINISLSLGLAVAFTGRLSLGKPQSLALFFQSRNAITLQLFFTLELGEEEAFTDKLLQAEESESRNGSHSHQAQTGCGWTKMTILEDKDDRLRYEHNERHLGSESK